MKEIKIKTIEDQDRLIRVQKNGITIGFFKQGLYPNTYFTRTVFMKTDTFLVTSSPDDAISEIVKRYENYRHFIAKVEDEE